MNKMGKGILTAGLVAVVAGPLYGLLAITGSSEKMKLWSLWGNALGFSGTAVKSFLPNDYDMKKEYDNMGVKLVDNKWMHQL